MLRKLLKHEFRATGRIMLPLFLILLATSVGANLSIRGMLDTDNRFLNILGSLLIVAFVVAVIGVCVMSMVVMVQRFYKNLLQDEGYVMMTLPVSTHQHIWSKLIVSAVWFALTILIVCLACLIMAADVTVIGEIVSGCQDLFRHVTAYYAINGTAIVAEFLVLCFVGCCAMCLQFYAALAIGHSFPNHKMAWSVLWFFLIQFIMQFLGGMGIMLLDESWFHHLLLGWTVGWNISGMAAMHLSMILMILGELFYGAVFYFLTTYFLKRRLNLE